MLAKAEMVMEEAQMQLPSLVQQGVAARLSRVACGSGSDRAAADVPAVHSVSQLVPIVP